VLFLAGSSVLKLPAISNGGAKSPLPASIRGEPEVSRKIVIQRICNTWITELIKFFPDKELKILIN